MLNSSITSSICEYLTNEDIVKLHRITRFYNNIRLWNERLVDDKDLSKDYLDYIINSFPIRCLETNEDHPVEFYDRFTDLIRFEPHTKISRGKLIHVLSRNCCIRVLSLTQNRNIGDLSFLSMCRIRLPS
jgi:hypothetical protein